MQNCNVIRRDAGHLAGIAALFLGIGLLLPRSSDAYQILPRISDVDRKLVTLGDNKFWNLGGLWIVDHVLPRLKSPVHEAITLAALDCPATNGEEMGCVTLPAVKQNQMLLYGVRWPDDPPFRLDPRRPPAAAGCSVDITVRSTAQPKCWRQLFDDAGRQARTHKGATPAFGPGTMLLYRSHYGDLQFMHAMAAYEGEPAGLTQANMRMWAQFLWGVADGSIRTDISLREAGGEELGRYFPGDMTATNLFATGIIEARSHLREVALGALLHMVQDSYSRAHVSRSESSGARCSGFAAAEAPGVIEEFHSYVRQDGPLHDHADTSQALAKHTLAEMPSVVAVSRELIRQWRQGAKWTEVAPYMDCVLAVRSAAAPAGAGPFVAKGK